MSRKAIVRVGFVVLAMLTMVGNASPQAVSGAHVSLRSKIAPYAARRRYAKLWADGNYAYMGSDQSSGVLIFDVSNPDAPFLIANYFNKYSYDMEAVKVASGIGYFASNNGGGLHIVNVADPYHPTLITRITSAMGGFDSIHNIALDGNYLYMGDYLAGSQTVQAWDVSNPAVPVLVRAIQTTNSGPVGIHDVLVQHGRLYSFGWGGNIDMFDVSQVATQTPLWLGTIQNGGNTATCAVTADDHYAACTNERFNFAGLVTLYDISDPGNAVLVSTITTGAEGVDGNSPEVVQIVGNTLYVTWCQAGLLVFDITDAGHPLMIGAYDEYPGVVSPSLYDGAWALYAYMGADRVMIGDRDTGLYILDTTQVSASPVLFNFKMNPTTLIGGAKTTGTAYLVGNTPATGLTVVVTANAPVVPTEINLVPGATSGNGSIATQTVSTLTTAAAIATYGGVSVAANLQVKPDVPTLYISPSSVIGTQTVTGRLTFPVTLTADSTVTLTALNGAAAVASLPASVTVRAGASTAAFSIVTAPVATSTTVQIGVSVPGGSNSAGFTVKPNQPASLTFSPSSIAGGLNVSGTVNLAVPAGNDTLVALTVSGGGGAISSLPGTVTVAAGQNTVTFTALTAPVATATPVSLVATLNGVAVTGTLTVKPNAPTLSITPNTVIATQSATGKITFAAPVVSDTDVPVTVTSGAAAVSSIPTVVTVPAGASSASFAIVTAAVAASTTVTVSASGASNASFVVQPITPTGLTFLPTSVVGGLSSTGTVSLSVPASSATVVTFSVNSGATAVNNLPASVIVSAGQTSATFTLMTNPVASTTMVSVATTLNGVTKTGTLTVRANTLTLSFSPSSVVGGANATGRLTLGAAVSMDTTVTLALTQGASAIASLPATVTVPAGQTFATFAVATNPVANSTVVLVVPIANGVSRPATPLTVNPNSPSSVTFYPTSVTGGKSSTGRVAVVLAVQSDTLVGLTVSTGSAAVNSIPSSVTIKAGTNSASFVVSTLPVSGTTVVQVAASANGGSKSGSFTVN